MTYDDDFIRVQFTSGAKNLGCLALGIAWPPPEFLTVFGFPFRRVRYSALTDEERATTDLVMRGAEYEPMPCADAPDDSGPAPRRCDA